MSETTFPAPPAGPSLRTRRLGEKARWDSLSNLLTRAQLLPGVTDADVVREAEERLAEERDPAWRVRWTYARAVAQLAGDELDAARGTAQVVLEEANRSEVAALVTMAHALRSWVASVRGDLEDAVEAVGRAVAIAKASDHRSDVEDWSAAILLIGNGFGALELFEHAERWFAQHAELPADRVPVTDVYAAHWNLCAVTGRLALGSVRQPPFEPDRVLFAQVAGHGTAVDALAAEHGFERPGWGALWIATVEAFVGDPTHALEALDGLSELQDDVSLQRSAGDVWRIARLRAMLRTGHAHDALAWDDARFGELDRARGPRVVHGEELAWERLMASTAGNPAGRAAAHQYAAVAQRRSVLGSALATDQLVARVAELAGKVERERLREAAARDPLTDVLNRRGLMPLLEDAAAAPAPTAYGVFVVDVDRFKRVNDSVSHATGDEVLRQVAAVLSASARSRDAVARLGGDEFALLALIGTDAASLLGERLAGTVREATKHAFQVTVSVGVAVRTAPVDADAWLHAADQAMFEAKRVAPGSVRVTTL